MDDMLITCKEKTKIENSKKLLNTTFDMKDSGAARKILRIEIIINKKEGTIFLSQEKYLKRVLETFDILDSKPKQSPLAAYLRLLNLFCPKMDEQKSEKQKLETQKLET